MTGYREENRQAVAARDSAELARISRLSVRLDSATHLPLVSFTAEGASLDVAVRRVLEAASVAFTFDGVVLAGRTTARFRDLPVVDALNLLIGPSGYVASMRGDIVAVGYGAPPLAGTQKDTDPVSAEVPVYNLDAKALAPLLDGLVKSGALRAVYIAPSSVVAMSGTRREVSDATVAIRRVDRASPHIFMEALIVEFDVETLEQLSASIGDGAVGNYSGGVYNPGSLATDVLSFVRVFGSVNPTKFTAYIQAVAGENKARIIARPYITTRSGEAANLDIGRQRTYLTSQATATGAFQSGSVQVPSGVVLRMTPTTLPGDRIRVDLHLEESQFIPTSGNIAAERDVNVAESSMQVASGETIVIGGLMLERTAHNVTGIPLLWRLPLIGNLFRASDKSGRQQQVVLFVTPRIWNPGIDAPLVRPSAFDINAWVKDSRPAPEKQMAPARP